MTANNNELSENESKLTDRELFEQRFPASTVEAEAILHRGGEWHIEAIVDADKWFSDRRSVRTDETYFFRTAAPQPKPYVAGQLVEITFIKHDNDVISLTFEKVDSE